MAHLKKTKINTEAVSEVGPVIDILDKDFETTVLSMGKELKEQVEKVKKIMC